MVPACVQVALICHASLGVVQDASPCIACSLDSDSSKSFGRKGVAQALVRACEGVAAAANFLDIYIQAAVISRDSSSLLGGWLSQEYQVGVHTSHSGLHHSSLAISCNIYLS